jgi:PAS domain S-box-containing protein
MFPGPPPPFTSSRSLPLVSAVSDADLLRDPARLAALCDSGLADSPPEEAFDRLTRLASRLLGAPLSTLSLVDDARQFFKAQTGLPEPLATARQTPLTHSICRHVVSLGAPLLIPDTLLDERVRANPMVAGFGIRAYAGVPVATAGGYVLGSLCVADVRPREWSAADLEALTDLAAVAGAEIELRRARGGGGDGVAPEAEGWFRPLVEQSIAAIYLYQDGRFLYVNPRCAEIFGYPLEEFAAPGFLERVIHPEDFPLVRDNVRRRLSGEEFTRRYSFRGVRADGSVLYLEVHGTRLEIDGRPALMGVGIDVTEQVRAGQEREAAVAARDRFYAMVSHELRTPISTIMLYNDLLLSGMCDPVTDAQREAVDRSQKSARHLLELINDLLDLSKLEAGKMEPRLEDVEVAELVEGVFAGVAPLAAEHGCVMTLEMPVRPLPVTGDARRVRQILLNLLSNAVKFGRGRPVEVRCLPMEGGVSVEVTDHGPGIDPADVPRIFEEFVQLGGDEGEVGTGLGLPIARRLAELLGGRLEVRTAPGQGSTFRLFLPEGHFSGVEL